jgi:hypothetical protein
MNHMSLKSGARLGSYEITGALGAGGMGNIALTPDGQPPGLLLSLSVAP